MKKLIGALAFLLVAGSAFAQTGTAVPRKSANNRTRDRERGPLGSIP